ncbi:spermatogenesis-associated serine-rich protein 2 isoform X2 [Callorhinchus milii]|uniref:spermatogenesis-associated serine-rich protein 2 isoform X2 n=1 Tax=Callorhinchus milii TaxID=7868 RepID=UPI001C3F8D42|nr:spermatogenesis-associated serine-rich protein 2 isoform X2 [Callorhinchus milii]
MAKKQSQKDPTGVVFDTRSKAVMAHGGSNENIKEKITAVRAIVPNRSKNEIILVLQHYDNCVDKAVQAFMEGYATEVLKEWSVTGKKKNKKKKKPKPQVKTEPEPDPEQTEAPGKGASNNGDLSAASSEKDEINGYHVNGSVNGDESVDSLSEHLDTLSMDAQELEDCESMTLEAEVAVVSVLDVEPSRTQKKLQSSHPSHRQHPPKTYQQRNANKSRPRTNSGSQSAASLSLIMPEEGMAVSSKNKKLGANIEKSAKDLQRCTVSLARYGAVIKEEMDISIKKMKAVFADLQNCLMDREVALLGEMDKVKAAALEILDSRQKKAEGLKRMTDSAVRMSEEQLAELRADIKHFVSERKYDEDLGRSAQFTCDVEELKASIQAFGQVSHPRNNYSARSRCSSVSSMSVTSRSDISAPSTPDCTSNPNLTRSGKKVSSSGEPSTASANSAARPFPSNRPMPQGNRRSGYRPQPNRLNPSHGRNEDRNRPRNGARNYYSSARPSGPPRPQPPPQLRPQPQPLPADKSQTHSATPNGTPAAKQPPLAQLAPKQALIAPPNALPQRRPRSSANEATTDS